MGSDSTRDRKVLIYVLQNREGLALTRYYLGDLTWEEAEKKLKEVDFVLLPIGSTEQHGPHLPLCTDYALTEMICKKLVEDGLNAIIAPTVAYGCSEHHMRFPGTISLKEDSLYNLVRDICDSLFEHGVKRVLIVNGHGGNREVLQILARDLLSEGKEVLVVNWWEFTGGVEDVLGAETVIRGHACEIETSFALCLMPEKVRKDKIPKDHEVRDPRIDIDGEKVSLKPIHDWKELSEDGSIGVPSRGSVEAGEEMIKRITDHLLKALKKYLERSSTSS